MDGVVVTEVAEEAVEVDLEAAEEHQEVYKVAQCRVWTLWTNSICRWRLW